MAWKFADDRSKCHDSWRFILGIAAEVSSTIGGWHLGHIPEEWLMPIWCQVHSAFFRIAADLAGCSMVTRDVMQSLEGGWCKNKLKFSLDILMCCHGHAQPLQPVASAHLWGRHYAGVALTKPELEVGCLRGDDFGFWIHGEGGMLLAGHHMEPPNRTGTTLKWKIMKDADGNRHIFGEGWKQLNADLKLHSRLCAHGLFEYLLDRSAKAVSRLGTHLI